MRTLPHIGRTLAVAGLTLALAAAVLASCPSALHSSLALAAEDAPVCLAMAHSQPATTDSFAARDSGAGIAAPPAATVSTVVLSLALRWRVGLIAALPAPADPRFGRMLI